MTATELLPALKKQAQQALDAMPNYSNFEQVKKEYLQFLDQYGQWRAGFVQKYPNWQKDFPAVQGTLFETEVALSISYMQRHVSQLLSKLKQLSHDHPTN